MKRIIFCLIALSLAACADSFELASQPTGTQKTCYIRYSFSGAFAQDPAATDYLHTANNLQFTPLSNSCPQFASSPFTESIMFFRSSNPSIFANSFLSVLFIGSTWSAGNGMAFQTSVSETKANTEGCKFTAELEGTLSSTSTAGTVTVGVTHDNGFLNCTSIRPWRVQ